jgi:hypothetical protein
VTNGTSKYCSRVCTAAGRRTKINRICDICGVVFKAYACHVAIGNGKYCGKACANVARSDAGRFDRICEHCGEVFKAYLSRIVRGGGKYCSRACIYTVRSFSLSVEVNGVRMTVDQLASIIGIGKAGIRHRIRCGATLKELCAPPRPGKRTAREVNE